MPGEGLREKPNTQDGTNGAVHKSLVKIRAGSGKTDANIHAESLIGGGERRTIGRKSWGDDGGVVQSAVHKTAGNARNGDSDSKEGGAETIESRHRCPRIKNQLGFDKEFAEPAETLKLEISGLSRDVFLRVMEIVFPDSGTSTTVDDGVADLSGGGHDFFQQVIVDVVVEGVAIGRAEVEDHMHCTGLGYSENGVTPETRDRLNMERASAKTGLQPADDVIRDKRTVFNGGRGVWLHGARQGRDTLAGRSPDDQFGNDKTGSSPLRVSAATNRIHVSENPGAVYGRNCSRNERPTGNHRPEGRRRGHVIPVEDRDLGVRYGKRSRKEHWRCENKPHGNDGPGRQPQSGADNN